MGSRVDVRCTNCGLAAEQVRLGGGLDPIWQFFEVRVFYCGRCEALHPVKVLKYARALKARLGDMDEVPWSVSSRTPGQRPSFELSPSQLATLLLDARLRPLCKCKAALRGAVSLPANADGVDAAKCPRCREVTLVMTDAGLWD